ncbi:hypothetical protein GSI_03117 [Ganoderma sinense ZZ0214-1]|uniref:Uncharacterized protein n=1 Tax=Ganoderma sinense ZZ0214-1 TaxID=1077348 RepID=A0A2G8SKR0_9APHY|nr:hypothetical protein GSI_03117 [Ganoderma sinense ZZ0214-1]
MRLQRELNAALERRAEIEDEVVVCRRVQEQLENEVRRCKEHLATQVQNVSRLEEKLAAQLDLHRETSSSQLVKYCALEKRFEGAKRDHDSTREVLKDLQTEFDSCKRRAENQDAETGATIKALSSEVVFLRDENVALQSEVSHYRERSETLGSQLEDVTTDLDVTRTKCINLEFTLEERLRDVWTDQGRVHACAAGDDSNLLALYDEIGSSFLLKTGSSDTAADERHASTQAEANETNETRPSTQDDGYKKAAGRHPAPADGQDETRLSAQEADGPTDPTANDHDPAPADGQDETRLSAQEAADRHPASDTTNAPAAHGQDETQVADAPTDPTDDTNDHDPADGQDETRLSAQEADGPTDPTANDHETAPGDSQDETRLSAQEAADRHPVPTGPPTADANDHETAPAHGQDETRLLAQESAYSGPMSWYEPSVSFGLRAFLVITLLSCVIMGLAGSGTPCIFPFPGFSLVVSSSSNSLRVNTHGREITQVSATLTTGWNICDSEAGYEVKWSAAPLLGLPGVGRYMHLRFDNPLVYWDFKWRFADACFQTCRKTSELKEKIGRISNFEVFSRYARTYLGERNDQVEQSSEVHVNNHAEGGVEVNGGDTMRGADAKGDGDRMDAMGEDGVNTKERDNGAEGYALSMMGGDGVIAVEGQSGVN